VVIDIPIPLLLLLCSSFQKKKNVKSNSQHINKKSKTKRNKLVLQTTNLKMKRK